MSGIWMTWGDVFNTSLKSLSFNFVQFVPNLVVAIVFFIVGWVLGSILAKALEQVFSALKIDNLFKSIGADDFFRKAGMSLNTGHFVGQVLKWFVIIVFLLPSLNLVGLNSIADFLKGDVVGKFIPHLFVAIFILIIAAFISQVLSKTVSASAKSVGLVSANLIGVVAKYAVWIFALIAALGQLGVADNYMLAVFIGAVTMISLAGGLAFGLGGRDAAARLIAKIGDEASHR